MEAKETAGLAMTKRVARDCRSVPLETTSNRLWRTSKMNTHQLLRSERRRGNQGRKKMKGEGGNGEAAGSS